MPRCQCLFDFHDLFVPIDYNTVVYALEVAFVPGKVLEEQ